MGWFGKLLSKKTEIQKAVEREAADVTISEPILSFAAAVQKDPKRFTVTTEVTWREIDEYLMSSRSYKEGYYRYSTMDFRVTDTEEGLSWQIKARMGFNRQLQGCHSIFHYDVRSISTYIDEVYIYPDFLTRSEVAYLTAVFHSVYGQRLARYKEVNRARTKRVTDRREAERKALAIQERKALMEVYCK